MFQKFADYLYYLLPAPFKRIKKDINQWYILWKVIGSKYDEVQNDLEQAANETTIATCSDALLVYHGADRHLTQYKNEGSEEFRSRIAMADEMEYLGGTKDGLILSAKATGVKKAEYYWLPEVTGDYDRWAEFYLFVYDSLDGEKLDVDFDVLRNNIRDVKNSESKDNYRWVCTTECTLEHGGSAKVLMEEDLTFFDGTYCFDGSREFQPGKSEEVEL